MNITSHYPWPVLGDEDAVSGIFAPSVEITFDKNVINIRGNFNLNNRTIQDMISSGKANYVLQLTCKATHLRQCYSFSDSQFEIPMPADDLRGVVQLDYFVLAKTNIADYLNDAAHVDYGGAEAKVSLTSGDVLAQAGPEKFDAKKKYAGTRNISDILEVVRDPNLTGPMIVDARRDKIVVRLPSIDFDKLAIFSNSKTEKVNSILQSSVAFPALIASLQYAFEEQESYGRFIWFSILKDRAEKAKIEWSKENILDIAQEILKRPIGRMLSGLKEIIESTE